MSNNQNDQSIPVIACNPSAIATSERNAHVMLSKEIFSSATIQDVKELADGYAFRLPLQTPMILKVAQYITNERLCCSFFTFTLIVDNELWLHLTGTPEVKQVIKTDILKILDTGIFPSLESLQADYDAAVNS
jgi:hypothetical protein